MAGGGDDGEMNPYIAYVDLFSSVILVLLLFVLIMFVNVGYYMQFNAKKTGRAVENNPMATVKVEPQGMMAPPKEIAQDEKAKVKTDEGLKEDENNTTIRATEKSTNVEYKESDLMIVFNNNEYFINKRSIAEVATTVKKILKTKPNAKFEISVGDSKKIISSTQAKQVSLARVLSFKNELNKVPELKDRVSINYKQNSTLSHEFGYLKIDVKQ